MSASLPTPATKPVMTFEQHEIAERTKMWIAITNILNTVHSYVKLKIEEESKK